MSLRPILIMAGGTGGHVYPALAVAQELQAASQKVIWLGTERGLEARVVPEAGIDIEWLRIGGLRGKGFITKLLAPFRLLAAVSRALGVMRRLRPAAVLGMGGYASGPGGIAAWMTRSPLVIHEQNAVAGLTNRILARFANIVLQAFPGSFPNTIHAVTVGNPVRKDIAAMPSPAQRYADRQGRLRLLVLGGSQGALILNRVLPAALARLPEQVRPEVWHQAGAATIDTATSAYEANKVAVRLVEFIEDMAEAYAWADLVVCRAGALTVAELCAAGVPAIFVPFALAVDDHQTANAGAMVSADAATLIAERDLNSESLAAVLADWLQSREWLAEKATNARELAEPEALARITGYCLEAAGATS